MDYEKIEDFFRGKVYVTMKDNEGKETDVIAFLHGRFTDFFTTVNNEGINIGKVVCVKEAENGLIIETERGEYLLKEDTAIPLALDGGLR